MAANRFDLGDDSIAVVIGSGAGGGVLANELCQRGKRVVCLEAGPRLTFADYRNDELYAYQQLTWLDKRTTTGTWTVATTSPSAPVYTVKSAGGTTNHWGALAFRMQPHEIQALATFGALAGTVLADWPIGLQELEHYWSLAEDKMGVTGTHGIPLLPVTNNYKVLDFGGRKLGYKMIANDRHAINSRPRDGRPSCFQLGFCGQGCKSSAKWSTLYTEIPKAEATGRFELRPRCMALQVEHDAAGRVKGVLYVDEHGRRLFQKAKLVAVAGNAIETPRLLLNSASGRYPHGLANDSGWVGRSYLKHINASVWGLYDKPVHMNHGVAMGGTIYDEASFAPQRGFVGGYMLQSVHVGIPFLAAVIKPDGWGREFTKFLESYDHLAGIWINGEDMPRVDNRVTLHATERDAYGLPIPNIHVDEHANDIAMREHALRQAEAVLRAAGATDTLRGVPLPSSHNMGTCRMSATPTQGVTNSYGQTHEIDNLFITDGSLFPTSSAENPTQTIVALAIRQADFIARHFG